MLYMVWIKSISELQNDIANKQAKHANSLNVFVKHKRNKFQLDHIFQFLNIVGTFQIPTSCIDTFRFFEYLSSCDNSFQISCRTFLNSDMFVGSSLN